MTSGTLGKFASYTVRKQHLNEERSCCQNPVTDIFIKKGTASAGRGDGNKQRKKAGLYPMIILLRVETFEINSRKKAEEQVVRMAVKVAS